MATTNYEPYLQTALSKYKYSDTAKRDVLNVFRTFKDLRPSTDVYIFNNGSRRDLLNLEGTIPVNFRGAVYNIPIMIWILDKHPYKPPLAYVKPTSTMQIKPGKHVDGNGKIDLPYFRKWRYPQSDLNGLIQILVIVFGDDPPVYSKVSQAPARLPYPPGQLGSTPYPSAQVEIYTGGIPQRYQGARGSLPTWQDEVKNIAISDSDSEDVEMKMAIAASLNEVQNKCRQQGEIKVPELLKDFYKRHIGPTDVTTNILVNRRFVLDSAFRALSRPSFKPDAKLNVKFCEGETTQNYGCRKREFFKLAIEELSKSNMFSGLADDKLFQHNLDRLEKGHYKLAGKFVALSFVHDGAWPHFLNEHLFELMTDLPTDLSLFNLAALAEDEREILEKLQAIETHSNREDFLKQFGEWLIDQGFSNPYTMKIEEKDQFFKSIIKQLVFYRQSSEIQDFTTGMNEMCGFWDFVLENASEFKQYFCNPPTKLTKESFLALCKTNFAVEGSDRRQQEEDTQYAWEVFLLDIEEKTVDTTFSELLVFITGADKPPCRGFQQQISINFYDMEEGEKRLPFVNTCSLELFLPRNIQDPEMLKDLMMTSLCVSFGFGKV